MKAKLSDLKVVLVAIIFVGTVFGLAQFTLTDINNANSTFINSLQAQNMVSNLENTLELLRNTGESIANDRSVVESLLALDPSDLDSFEIICDTIRDVIRNFTYLPANSIVVYDFNNNISISIDGYESDLDVLSYTYPIEDFGAVVVNVSPYDLLLQLQPYDMTDDMFIEYNGKIISNTHNIDFEELFTNKHVSIYDLQDSNMSIIFSMELDSSPSFNNIAYRIAIVSIILTSFIIIAITIFFRHVIIATYRLSPLLTELGATKKRYGLFDLNKIAKALARTLPQKVKQLIYYDELTGLPNRRMFKSIYNSFVDRHSPFTVMLLDIKGFNTINNLWGDLVGDKILIDIATKISSALEGTGGEVIRYFGDEFIIVIENREVNRRLKTLQEEALSVSTNVNLQTRELSQQIKQHLRPYKLEEQKRVIKLQNTIIGRDIHQELLMLKQISQTTVDATSELMGNKLGEFYERCILSKFINPLQFNDKAIQIVFNAVAIATPEETANEEELITKMLVMLHKSKELCMCGLLLFSNDVYSVYMNEERVKDKLKTVSFSDEFIMYYQPIIDANHSIVKAEALVRWFSPELGFVPPNKFIYVAEQTRDIIDLGYWIIERVAKDISTLNIPLQVSINISPIQIMEIDFVPSVMAILDSYNISYQNICFEITEGILLEERTIVKDNIRLLQNLGIQFALDDFGTGYSSFSYLKDYSLEILKIDKMFVDNTTSKDYAIISGITKIAQSLNMEVILEGVETAQQFETLKKFGLIQGYYFAKPMGWEEFKQLL
ncbi:MAG: hypothetical protein ATN33_05855 [Epulopiscium sp. Nele67-Bin001]|nr:MAG: hypothetical protein ATN33_05855 [Epulopiscium sp. Nele67-Bin001]